MTTENNKIIAEFMEWDILNDMTYSKATKGKWIELDKLKFHSNWNWLMEVVEKIESLDFNVSIFRHQNKQLCCISIPILDGQDEGIELVKEVTGEKFSLDISGANKIETVYTACVEFIKWYNEQKKE